MVVIHVSLTSAVSKMILVNPQPGSSDLLFITQESRMFCSKLTWHKGKVLSGLRWSRRATLRKLGDYSCISMRIKWKKSGKRNEKKVKKLLICEKFRWHVLKKNTALTIYICIYIDTWTQHSACEDMFIQIFQFYSFNLLYYLLKWKLFDFKFNLLI